MSSILIGLFTLILVIICILLVLVILMQRPNANAGMGAALGGGAAQDMFGGETGNVLTKATVKLTILFFLLSAGLYLGYIYATSGTESEAQKTISISSIAPATPKQAENMAPAQEKPQDKAPAKKDAASPAAAKQQNDAQKAAGALPEKK